MHRFKEGDYSQKLSNHIKDEFSTYFKYSSERLYLVVSGDFTYTASKSEFDSALEFVKEVCDCLKIDKYKVIFTPGNHDIDWKSAKIDLTYRFDNYISFLYNFYGKDLFKNLYPEIYWDLSINTDRPNPEEIMSIQLYSEHKLLFVSFNSCMYETDQDHYGFIGGKQFKIISKYLIDKNIDDNYTKIAVTHHHLLPHPASVDISEKEIWMDLSIIRDSGLVEYKLENLGFDLILHGHKHKPQLRETLVRDKYNSKHTKKLIVCGAGSCGVNASELEHNQSNHYQVLEVLNLPRTKDIAFFKLIWRELEVNDSAEWYTSIYWLIYG
jgi:predicted phosphodiesterase